MISFRNTLYKSLKLLRLTNPVEGKKRDRLIGWIHSNYATLSNNQIRRLIDSGFCFDFYTHRWLNRWLELEEWLRMHKNEPPARSKLGFWVSTQRNFKAKGKLSLERIGLLNRLNFQWTPFLKAHWNEKFLQLKKWHDQHGNTTPPISTSDIGIWTFIQRKRRAEGKLSKERIQLLNTLNFTWDYQREVSDRRWQEKLNAVRKFHDKYGHFKIGQKDPELTCFLERIRTDFHKLSPDKKRDVRAVGIPLHPKNDSRDLRIQQLTQYYRKHGHTGITKDMNRSLAAWTFHIREYYRRGILDPKIKTSLDKLGFYWDPKTSKWDKRVRELKEYLSSGGRIPIPYKLKQFSALAHWISNVRQGIIQVTRERRRQLDKIGFPWKGVTRS